MKKKKNLKLFIECGKKNATKRNVAFILSSEMGHRQIGDLEITWHQANQHESSNEKRNGLSNLNAKEIEINLGRKVMTTP